MRLTQNQRRAVGCDENAFVVACPGSGKTRVLVAKLLRSIDEVRDTPRRVACITYTNAAVDEIESRLRQYGSIGDDTYCEIATIHSFCLTNVIRYFAWRLPGYTAGLNVLPPDAETYQRIAADVCTDYNLPHAARGQFENIHRSKDGTAFLPADSLLTLEAAHDFWERIRDQGFADFPSILYYAYHLLVTWPSIARALACRFAWFLLDESQDTSAIQIEALRLIAAAGRTRFFLVGDPYQSIYAFTGATPQGIDQFATSVCARRDFPLVENFRASNPLVQAAERLCPRTPPMISSGTSRAFSEQPLHVHSDTAFTALVDYFIPWLEELGIPYGESAVLAPTWHKLRPLGRQLRQYGLPVVGPGARPYRRTRTFARLAEQLCAYAEHPSPDRIPDVEREVFRVLLDVTGQADFRVYTYDGRRAVIRLLWVAQELRQQHEGAIAWLQAAAGQCASVLCEREFLPTSSIGLFLQSVSDMRNDMVNNREDIDNMLVADLGLFANPDDSIKLLTMHAAKGREFDAVALVDLHEGVIPHWRTQTSEVLLAEQRRLLYVAATRARRVLLCVTDDERPRPVSRFLSDEGLALVP